MNNFYNTNDAFENIFSFTGFSDTKNTDKDILDTLLLRLDNYDINDFICRVSALNLIPDNQNKCIIFDNFIEHILTSINSSSHSSNKMSSKKFKEIVETGTKLNLAMNIDPIEMPFIQRIQFYGNKWIFSGINSSPAFILLFLLFISIVFPAILTSVTTTSWSSVNFIFSLVFALLLFVITML